MRVLRQFHSFIRSFILQVIDSVHSLFFRFIPIKQFRYAACGPHIAAFLIAFAITFPIGFYLNLYVVFEGSYLKRRIQLFRYFTVAMLCILLNYLFLKLFVEQFGWYPTPSAMTATVIVTLCSYLLQQHYSFRRGK
ncbi:GtrA family protein [Olivibacter ginsenosidimutans]|uniref:GtrA family protein n=1 Tax=Olivibacter ginsenosidimutans TaxID=1176537 RepID=UPI0031F1A2AB